MANSIAAVLPQFWALEGLRRLMELTPAVGSVNRQFASELASAGDTVNAWRADRRTVRRKTRDDEYTETNANVTAVPVKLDQYFFDTIVIKDEEEALTIPELTRTHLMPMIEAIARGMDRAVLGRVHAFLRQGTPLKRAGRLNKISTSNASDFILEAEEVLIGNLAPMEGLWTAIVHHTANTKLMGTDVFQRADARGTSPTLVTGEVGTVYNTRVLVSQNVNYVYSPTSDIQTAAINNSGGYAAGTTAALTVTDPGTDWTVGEYVVVDGNDQPTFVSATSAATDITLNEELKYAVVDTAPITHFLKGTNEATERTAGYQKTMTFTHTSGKNYQIGQLISFGTGGSRHTYTIIEVTATTATTTTVLLDRPLDATVAASADCFPGPHGSMNPVMHEDAIAFVSRNMRVPQGRDGANGAVQNFRGVGLRVVTQYDSKAGGTRVNVDVLAGISVLDEDLLVVMCA
jgi:hypothetical protein